MADCKCLKCGTVFLSVADERIKFPICAECLTDYRQWLVTQPLVVASLDDDLYYKKQWVRYLGG